MYYSFITHSCGSENVCKQKKKVFQSNKMDMYKDSQIHHLTCIKLC